MIALLKALLKKDRLWLTLFAQLGLIAPLAVALDGGGESILVVPVRRTFDDLGLALWIPALVLGIYAALHEELLGTRAYLRQRPVAPVRVAAARLLGCAAVVALWTLVAALGPALYDLFAGARLQGLDASACAPLGAVGTQALATGAAGYFAASLPASFVARTIVLAVGWFVVHVAAALLGGAPDAAPQPLRIACAMLAIAAMLALAAVRHERHAADPDRPLPATQTASLVVATALLAIVSNSVAALWQSEALDALSWARPRFAAVAERIELIAARRDRRTEQHDVLDGSHRATGATVGLPALRAVAGVDIPLARLPDLLQPNVAPSQHATLGLRGGKLSWVRVDAATGDLIVIERDIVGHHRARLRLRRSDDVGLSPLAESGEFDRGEPSATMLVGDPRDGTLWQLELTPTPHLAAVPWPDRFRNFAHRQGDAGWELAVIGETRTWRWRDSGLIEAGPAAERHAEQRRGALRCEITDADPLTPTAVAHTASGQREHRFALHTAEELTLGALACATAALRPPLLAAASLATTWPEPYAWLLDPLIASRPWLFGLSLAVHGALAALVALSLRRRGASARRALAWAAGVLGGGVVVTPLIAAIETRRAHRRIVAQPAPRPLIITV